MQQFHAIETGGGGLEAPRRKRERVRHPGVAVVRVVLDHDQPPARPEYRADRREHGSSIPDEVEAVGGKHPVERPAWQASGEVARGHRHRDAGEAMGHGLGRGEQRPCVPVDRADRAGRSEDVGEGLGERPLAGTQLEPSRPRAFDAAADQGNVIGVVHRS